MSQVDILIDDEMRKILSQAINKQIPGILSHMSRGKWHMSKVILTNLGQSILHVEIAPREKPLPINIHIDQPVGLTFKLDFNKYICESVVKGLEPSINSDCGGKLLLDMPLKLEKMQKRNYYRVQLPNEKFVEAVFWHRGYSNQEVAVPSNDVWTGRLLDLSAGGLQLGIDISQKPNFKSGQLIGIKFIPFQGERPMILEGQIRHIAKTVDETKLCLGIQIVGLEASQEGREKLRRVVNIVERYLQESAKRETCAVSCG